MKWLFILLPFFAFAEMQRPLAFDFGGGVGYSANKYAYRLNNLDPSVPDQIPVEEDANLSNAVKFQGFFETVLERIFFLRGEGSYSFYSRQKVDARNQLTQGPQNFLLDSNFTVKAKGNAVAANGKGGFRLTIYRKKGRSIITLLPYGAYGYDRQSIKRPNTDTVSYDNIPGVPGTTNVSLLLSEKRYKQEWWGPFTGLMLDIEPLKSFHIRGMYGYHFLNFKTRFLVPILLTNALNPPPTDVLLVSNNARSDTSKARGQSAFVQIDYTFLKHLRVGIDLRYQKFKTGARRVFAEQEFQVGNPVSIVVEDSVVAGFRAEWIDYSALFTISAVF